MLLLNQKLGDEQIHLRDNRVSDIVSNKLNMGKVYTPTFLAEWVAETLLDYTELKKIVAIDPACGEGELLSAIKNKSKKKIEVVGVDLDLKAIAKARTNLKSDSLFFVKDALLPYKGVTYDLGWKKLLKNKSINTLIANPPWGADLLNSKEKLLKGGYSLANGQFDSWDLFIELSLSIVKRAGYLAFIIPDAIFLSEHQGVRKLLNEKTTILLIARLGEGFFKNVCRGTTIVICKNEPPQNKHKIEVFRLNKETRDSILKGSGTLSDARKSLHHFVPQKRFIDDAYSTWDIDFSEVESKRVKSLFSMEYDWTSLLGSGRGVELSKLGRIIVCPKCSHAVPLPRQPKVICCESCRHEYSSVGAKQQSIMADLGKKSKEWADFIAGEDVCRYRAEPSRVIRRFVSGINYKDESNYSKKRLLVRKTGLGINATIVDREAYTNQVVFHYFEKEKSKVPEFYLSYVLGVLSSRLMFAYHLKKSGENEWRSHPYVTQKILSRFPIPIPTKEDSSWVQAKAIANKVDKLLLNGVLDNKLDLEIECLVAGLYKFNDSDIEWVRNVIDSAQELAPMKQMKTMDISRITAVYA